MPVRNVIFDFGGVLVNWQPEDIIARFSPEPAVREALRAQAVLHDDWVEMDRGTLDEADLIRRSAARMGWPEATMTAFFDHVRASLTPIGPTIDLLTELSGRGYPLYGLSNMSTTIFAHLRGLHGFFGHFHGIVVSAEVKSVKPEPAIYEHLRRRYALDFAESVFIDDLPRNVEAARRLGLPAIRFESAAQVRAELEPLLAR